MFVADKDFDIKLDSHVLWWSEANFDTVGYVGKCWVPDTATARECMRCDDVNTVCTIVKMLPGPITRSSQNKTKTANINPLKTLKMMQQIVLADCVKKVSYDITTSSTYESLHVSTDE